ncbi:superinfection immunity protein [Paraburkholderia fungorum]|uniref:superinfection immunity protein n=1 Tax=Paraburkholderia fungorum TaxID=134537 RepID=UPI0038BBC6F8
MSGIVVLQAIAAVFALALYFLPSILADRRKRHDLLTLALFNACLGWTGFGWLLALYWSLQPNPPKNVAGEVVETRKIMRMRAFSSALVVRVQRRATTRERGEK